MDKAAASFLNHHRISVLGISQEKGRIHSASLHYAHTESPLHFFFITEKTSEKCKSLLSGEQKASLVIGFSEEEFSTFQAEGIVKIAEGKKRETAWDIYLEKYPSREHRKANDDFAILMFSPTWWRYRDMREAPMKEVVSGSL